MLKQNKAITLIALIITIIVLLILAGVTINMVLGDNGLFNKAKTSVAKYENAQERENNILNGYESEINSYINGNRDYETEISNLKEEIKMLKAQMALKPSFVDMNNLITTFAWDSDYVSVSREYTATEDCAVIGYFYLQASGNTLGGCVISINSSQVAYLQNNDTPQIGVPINYTLSKGDKITFDASVGKTVMRLKVYGLKNVNEE